ncbi:hypothetical protein H5410_043857 [Solanum commersonii]|uniref:Uncharacterized protein n=1 Tax=Solanum commersonii TaxID=4109 RepID=A0A9J5Y0H8_SOLCO|nr:hypothetical protein H5410_043857 [Solanum commersonii]
MASMQCYKEEGKEFDYYSYGNQKPTSYSSSGYEQSYYEKEKCYETKPEMMGYGTSHGHQHGSNPCGPMMGHSTGHGMGYGTGHNSTSHGMGYSTGHNGTSHGMGYALGHVMGFGKKHEGHSSYGMGSSGCTTYKKQHRRRNGYGSGSDCSDSSDDERHC